MKNLIGVFAPTNRILSSFKVLMLLVLLAIGFTSCKDRSKSKVSPEKEFIDKSNLCNSQLSSDIGGGKSSKGGLQKSFVIVGCQTPPRHIYGMYSISEIGGGKNSNGGLGKTSVTGGRGIQGTTSDYAVSDIGGKGTSIGTGQIISVNKLTLSDIGGKGGKGTSTGGVYTITEIGRNSSINTISRNIADIGGRQTNTTGNFALSDTFGRKGTSTDIANFTKVKYVHSKIYCNELD